MDNNKSLLTLLLALAILYALYNLYNNMTTQVSEEFRDIKQYDSDYAAVIPTFASEKRAEEVSQKTKQELEERSMCRCGPKCKCGEMCHCGPNQNCGKGCAFYVNWDGCSPKGRCRSGTCDPGYNWKVKQEPGYCGKTNDTRWFHMEPRMILKDNSMRCNDISCEATNGPPGIMDDTASQHIGTLENLQMPNDMVYNQFPIPVMGTSDMSQNTGIIPIPQDCAMKKAMKSSCSCGR